MNIFTKHNSKIIYYKPLRLRLNMGGDLLPNPPPPPPPNPPNLIGCGLGTFKTGAAVISYCRILKKKQCLIKF